MRDEQATGAARPAEEGKFRGWTMVGVAFLAQNFGVGINFGSYGPLVATIQENFDTSRAMASAGLSMASLTMCLLSPLIGSLVQRWSIRNLMLLGASLNAAGHLLLSMSDNIYIFLAIYGLLIGPGFAALGIIPGPTLISRWFVKDRGKALGIANMPLAIFAIPLLASLMLGRYGAQGVFLANAALFLLLIPILFLVVERPEHIGQKPRGAVDEAKDGAAAAEVAVVPNSVILRRPEFWLMCLGVGLMTAVGVMLTTHLVPLVMEKGHELTTASGMLSAYGLAVAVGALMWGGLSDRFGPMLSFAVAAFGLMLSMFILLVAPPTVMNYTGVIIFSALCCGGITTLHAGTINELFGRETFSRVMGLGYLAKLPFLFFAAPLAGYLFDISGNYELSLILFGASLALAILAFILMGALHRRRRGLIATATSAEHAA